MTPSAVQREQTSGRCDATRGHRTEDEKEQQQQQQKP
jgi:hypothetical protein